MLKTVLQQVFKARDKLALGLSDEDEEKPFLEHLEDLRKMIVRSAIALLTAMVVTFSFREQLFSMITAPIYWEGLESSIDFNTRAPIEGFMLTVRLSFMGGVIFAFPLLLFFLLQFVLPGLRRAEKKVLFPALAVGFGLFLGGASFCYFFVVARVLDFFIYFNTTLSPGGVVEIQNLWSIGEYVKFVSQLVLVFGAAFELPVVVMGLVKLDMLNYRTMARTRSYALVAVFVVAAVVTPTPDIMTLSLLALPMYVLYEICILLAYLIEKRDRRLHPEFYEDHNEDVVVADDWDRDDYDPWEELRRMDDEELKETGWDEPGKGGGGAEVVDEYHRQLAEAAEGAPEALEKPEEGEKTLEDYAADDAAAGEVGPSEGGGDLEEEEEEGGEDEDEDLGRR